MIYTIENERYCLSADTLGAELSSFYEKQTTHEYIWQKSDVWQGQSPLLFPIVGRLKEDCYVYNGQIYHLEKHGFARRREFVLEEQTAESMTFLLCDDAHTRQAYPFSFELRLTYKIAKSGFSIEYRVTNTNNVPIFFSIGAHPGFFCEMGDKIVFDRVETVSAFQLDENALRAQKLYPVLDHSKEIVLTSSLFDRDALIFEGLKSPGATLLRQNGKSVHVDFGGAPCLGIWAKPGGVNYVCIEPWYGIDDRWNAKPELTNKEQIVELGPANEFIFPVTITAI